MVKHYLCYIDPGTGSMLLTVILSLVTSAIFLCRGLFIKLKVKMSGGKIEDSGKVPYTIFSDHKRYWNIFESICDEFEKRELPCVFLTASEDDPVLSKEYKYVKARFIGEGNKCFAALNTLQSYICLSTTPGLDVLQWKRSKGVNWYVHTYHALGDGLGYRMFALDFYDAVLASGDIQYRSVRALEKLRNRPEKEIVTVGSTYMDRLYEQAQHYELKKNEITTVLLAPSWGASSILNKQGEEFINRLIQTGYRIIIRPHPQSKVSEKDMLDRLQAKFPNSDMLEWNYDNDNFKVLAGADILISDYSGVMFDYTFIFDRPFIYTNAQFDPAPYDAAWLERKPWLFEVLPLLGRELKDEDLDNIKAVIDETMGSQAYKENREKCKNEAWQYRGEAAKRTVDYMVGKYEKLKKAETEGNRK